MDIWKMKNKFLHTLESCYLCIKFPFLYPRNRFTGKHYTSWKLQHYLHDIIWNRAFINVQDESKDSNSPFYTLYTKTKVKSYFYACWFYIVQFWYDYVLQIIHCIPTFTELDALDEGWRKAFGIQMCKDLKQQLKKEGNLYKWRIVQIKEKFGCLCLYSNFSSDELNAIIGTYESLSEHTCIVCGKPAKYITPIELWRCPYCEEHVPSYVYEEFLEEIK